MSHVGAMLERRDIPAYVRFERRPVEDRASGNREGKYMSKDLDYALVTPPYSKDCFVAVATEWLEQMKRDAREGRLPQEWCDRYVMQYEHWKRGEELPLNGTAIKGWSVISPAQMKNLIAINILTVEDLAGVNEEGLRRIGMGASELRDKAKSWLAQTADKGPLTMEIAAVKAENQALKTRNEQLEARVAELSVRIEVMQRGGIDHSSHVERSVPPVAEKIAASDILEPVEEPKRARKAS